jgi:hypothetical protein
MLSSGMWYHVGLVRTNVLGEHVVSIFRGERIYALRTLAVTRMQSASYW